MVVRRERVVSAAPAEVWRVVSDPTRLAAWWPGVKRVEEASSEAWTTVLVSPTGKSVRADYSMVEAHEPERILWRHEVDESPFERLLTESTTEIALRPERPVARLCRDAQPAPARVGALQPAPAASGRAKAGRGCARGAGGAARRRRLMRWWGWGEDGHAVPLPPAAEGLLRDELGADPSVRKPPVPFEQVRLPDIAIAGPALENADRPRSERTTCASTPRRA